MKNFCNSYDELLLSAKPGLEFALLAQIRLWNKKWLRSSKNPSVTIPVSVQEALQNNKEEIYSLVNSLLSILLTYWSGKVDRFSPSQRSLRDCSGRR